MGTTQAISANLGPTFDVDVLQANRQSDGGIVVEVTVQNPGGVDTGNTIFALCGTIQDARGQQFTADMNSSSASANQEFSILPGKIQSGWLYFPPAASATPPLNVDCEVGNGPPRFMVDQIAPAERLTFVRSRHLAIPIVPYARPRFDVRSIPHLFAEPLECSLPSNAQHLTDPRP